MGDWKKCIAFMAKYVPLWVIISAGIAYMWPHLFRDYKVVISPCLSLIMLGMGLSMTPQDFKLITQGCYYRYSYCIYMYALGRDRLR